MCPQCFICLFLQFWFFYDCLTIIRRVNFFTAYSVDVGDFLPHTQQPQEIFYRILSSRRRFFTAYSVAVGDFLPHTQYTQHNFCRSLSRRGIISKICHPAVLCQRIRLALTQQAWNIFQRTLSQRKKTKMANNSLTILTNQFFALVLKSPIQMGWLSVINSVTNISRLGTFNAPLPRRECASREDFKSQATRIIPSYGTEDGVFNLNFQFVSLGSGVTDYTVDKLLQVWAR